MTIIVAQKTTTGVLMGADTLTVGNSTIFPRASGKIFAVSDRIVAGSSGLVRLGNALRGASWSEFNGWIGGLTPDDIETRLAGVLREAVKHEPADAPFWTLVALDRDIYHGGPGGSAVRVSSSYCAIGSGGDVALGALFASNGGRSSFEPRSTDETRVILTRALEAAAEHIEGIRAPWVFAETIAPVRPKPPA